MVERVTICVPAYQAEAFLEETLASAFEQTWPSTDIVVSVDAGADATAKLALRHRNRPWTRVIVQNRRLGWVANTNFALSQARTRYAMILPHDDILDADYVERCMEGFAEHPGAAVCYTDLDFVGNDAGPDAVQPSVLGSLEQRLEAILALYFDAIAFRGVVDRKIAPHHDVPRAIGGFAADTLHFTRLACQGGLVRMPGASYHKRLLPSSAHRNWHRATPEERHEMWAVHCLEMVNTIIESCPQLQWTEGLQAAWQYRVRSRIFCDEDNPTYADTTRSIAEHVSETFDRVRARPVPYSWVKSM